MMLAFAVVSQRSAFIARTTRFVVACGLLGTPSASRMVHAGDPIDKAAFVDQLSAAVGRVNDALRQVRVEGRSEHLLSRDKDIEDSTHAFGKTKIYTRGGGREKLEFFEAKSPNTYFHRILSADGDQGFVLRKNNQSADFFLEFPEIPSHSLTYLASNRNEMVGSITQFYLIDLASVLKDPKFVIEKVEREIVNEAIRNRVTFSLEESRSQKTGINTFLVKGYFDVDPNNSYAILAYKAHRSRTTKNSPTYFADGEGVVEYASGTALPEVKKVVARSTISHGQRTRNTFTVDSWSYAKNSDREFTLDYYGLGDFERPVAQTPHGLTFWATVVVCVALPLGLMLRVLHSRTRLDQA